MYCLLLLHALPVDLYSLVISLALQCPAGEIIAEEGSWILRPSRFTQFFTTRKWRHRLCSEIAMITYLTEGKALLECHDKLFRYLERMIALQKEQHPLAAAVRVCLG